MKKSEKKTKIRADILTVEQKLAPTRAKAQALIIAGEICTEDERVEKPGQLLENTVKLRIKSGLVPFVSRGALKLRAALQEFKIECTRKIALDVGSSTGGFTEILLLGGAARVHAIDVGTQQMDWKLRGDLRVILKENFNARNLKFEDLGEKVGLIVMDLSFISLTKVLPATLNVALPDADWVTLIKPQFEVGPGKVGKGGIVRDEALRQEVLVRIETFAKSLGLARMGLIDSPITGTDGNQEYLAHWKLV